MPQADLAPDFDWGDSPKDLAPGFKWDEPETKEDKPEIKTTDGLAPDFDWSERDKEKDDAIKAAPEFQGNVELQMEDYLKRSEKFDRIIKHDNISWLSKSRVQLMNKESRERLRGLIENQLIDNPDKAIEPNTLDYRAKHKTLPLEYGFRSGAEHLYSTAANAVMLVKDLANWIGDEKSAPYSTAVENVLRKVSKYVAPDIKDAPKGVLNKTISGFASAPHGIVEALTGIKAVGGIIKGLALTGAVAESHKGIKAAAVGAGEGALFGATLKWLNQFGKTVQALGTGTVAGTITAAHGASGEDIAAAVFVMFGIAGTMGKAPKGRVAEKPILEEKLPIQKSQRLQELDAVMGEAKKKGETNIPPEITEEWIRLTEEHQTMERVQEVTNGSVKPNELDPSELAQAIVDGKIAPWEITMEQAVTGLGKNPSAGSIEFIKKNHATIIRQALEKGIMVPEDVVLSNPSAHKSLGPARDIVDPFKKVKSGEQGFASGVLRTVFNKPIQNIRNLNTNVSRMLANAFKPYEFNKTPLEPGYFENLDLMQGKFLKSIDRLIEPHRGRFGVNRRTNDQIVRALRTGRIPKHLRNTVKGLRELYDEAIIYAEKVGIEIPRIENYFSRMWDMGKLNKNPMGAVKDLVEKNNYEYSEAIEYIDKIMRNEGMRPKELKGDRLPLDVEYRDSPKYAEWGGRVRIEGPMKLPAEKSRRPIDEETMKKWLVNDAEAVMSKYFEMLTRRVEMARIIGPGEGKLNQWVREIIEETRGTGIKVSQVTKDIYNFIDAAKGIYNPITSRSIDRVLKGIGAYETMAHMTLVAAASFPEMAAPIARFGIKPKSYAKGVLQAGRNAVRAADKLLTGKHNIKQSEAWEFLEEIGIIGQRALGSAQARRWTGYSGKWTDRFMRFTGLESLTNIQRFITADMLMSNVSRNVKYLAEGKQNTKSMQFARELTELGINSEAIVRHYKATGEIKFNNAAIVRGVHETIMKPDAANTPLWMQNPRWKLVAQFQKFFTVFGNTYIKRLGKEAIRKTTVAKKMEMIVGLTTMTAIAYYTQYLREFITGYKPKEEHGKKRIPDAFDRAGLTGPLTRAYPFVSGYKYGYKDSWAAKGFSLFGPAAGDVMRIGEDVYSLKPKKIGRRISKQIPIVGATKWTREPAARFFEKLLEAAGL